MAAEGDFWEGIQRPQLHDLCHVDTGQLRPGAALVVTDLLSRVATRVTEWRVLNGKQGLVVWFGLFTHGLSPKSIRAAVDSLAASDITDLYLLSDCEEKELQQALPHPSLVAPIYKAGVAFKGYVDVLNPPVSMPSAPASFTPPARPSTAVVTGGHSQSASSPPWQQPTTSPVQRADPTQADVLAGMTFEMEFSDNDPGYEIVDSDEETEAMDIGNSTQAKAAAAVQVGAGEKEAPILSEAPARTIPSFTAEVNAGPAYIDTGADNNVDAGGHQAARDHSDAEVVGAAGTEVVDATLNGTSPTAAAAAAAVGTTINISTYHREGRGRRRGPILDISAETGVGADVVVKEEGEKYPDTLIDRVKLLKRLGAQASVHQVPQFEVDVKPMPPSPPPSPRRPQRRGRKRKRAPSAEPTPSNERPATPPDPRLQAIQDIDSNDQLAPDSVLVTMDGFKPETPAFNALLEIIRRPVKTEVTRVLRAAVDRVWYLMHVDDEAVAKERALVLRDLGVGEALATLVENQTRARPGRKAPEVVIAAIQAADYVFSRAQAVTVEGKLCAALQKALQTWPTHRWLLYYALQCIKELAACVENAAAMIDARISVEITRALKIKSGKEKLLDLIMEVVVALGDHTEGGRPVVNLRRLGADLCTRLVEAMYALPSDMDAETVTTCVRAISVLSRSTKNTERMTKSVGTEVLAGCLEGYLEALKAGKMQKDDEFVLVTIQAVRNFASGSPVNQEHLCDQGGTACLLELFTTKNENDELETAVEDVHTLQEGTATIVALVEDYSGARYQFGALGVIDWIVKPMRQHHLASLHKVLLEALAYIVDLPNGDQQNRDRAMDAGAADAVLDVMEMHTQDDEEVQRAGCQVLWALVSEGTVARLGVRACNALVNAMRRYTGNRPLVHNALKAMVELCQGSGECQNTLRGSGAAGLVREAIAALREEAVGEEEEDEDGEEEEGLQHTGRVLLELLGEHA